MRITEEAVRRAGCPSGRKDALLFDDALPGFGLRVTAAGKRIFLYQYRNGAKVRRTTLGIWGTELTAAQARRKAETLRGQVRDRRDPVAERRARQAAAIAAEAEARAVAARAAYSVGVLIEQWTDQHLAGRSASYRAAAPRHLRIALADWLNSPASALSRADAVQVLDAVKEKNGPVAANRLRAEARACWTWAVRRGALADNPWSATPRPLARETPRERVLTDTELGALYAGAAGLTEPFNVLIRILILTGQRRGEVAGMRWDELALGAGQWNLPGSRTKNHQAHIVPLPSPAVTLLESIKRRLGSEVVFEGPRATAVSGFGKIKGRLDAALAGVAGEAGRPVEPWVLHDIRRTVATGMQRLGVRLEVTEAVLNHVSGSRSGIVGVYQRHGWAAEKKAALDAWAAHVLQAAGGHNADIE